MAAISLYSKVDRQEIMTKWVSQKRGGGDSRSCSHYVSTKLPKYQQDKKKTARQMCEHLKERMDGEAARGREESGKEGKKIGRKGETEEIHLEELYTATRKEFLAQTPFHRRMLSIKTKTTTKKIQNRKSEP